MTVTPEQLRALVVTLRAEMEDLVNVLDNRFYFNNGTPYTDEGTANTDTGVPYLTTAEVLTMIPVGMRRNYLTVNVAGVEYWFINGALTLKNAYLAITDGSVTLAKISNIASQTFLGRTTAGDGVTEVMTVAQAKALLGLTGIDFANYVLKATGYSLVLNTDIARIHDDHSDIQDLSGLVPYTGGTQGVNLTTAGAAMVMNGTGVSGYGVVGMASYVPLQGTNTSTTPNTVKLCEVINGTPDALNPVQVGYGLERRVDTPWLGDLLNKPMFKDDFILTDVTVNLESGKRELWCRKSGVWLLQATFDKDGNLTIPGNLYALNSNPVGSKTEWLDFTFPDIEASKVYTLDLDVATPYTILGLTLRSNTGTIETTLSINATGVLGCSATAVTTTKAYSAATGLNTTVIGNEVKLTINSLSGATALTGKLKFTR